MKATWVIPVVAGFVAMVARAQNAFEVSLPFVPQRVTASSVYAPGFDPSHAVDGDRSTYRPSTFHDDAWLAVDPGETRKFARIDIIRDAACAKSFAVQVSNDGQSWAEVHKTTDGKGGTTEIKLPSTEARYIRVVCTQRGTQWGNAIREFVVK